VIWARKEQSFTTICARKDHFWARKFTFLAREMTQISANNTPKWGQSEPFLGKITHFWDEKSKVLQDL
jgi:hypothetical protein